VILCDTWFGRLLSREKRMPVTDDSYLFLINLLDWIVSNFF